MIYQIWLKALTEKLQKPTDRREVQSLNNMIFPPIPRDTARAATAVFGRSNFYLLAGDRANQLFEGLDQGQSGKLSLNRSQAILFLITIFQYIEALPDHLVPGALHERLDWKYALHQPLNTHPLNPISLCDLRRQLGSDKLKMAYFQAMLLRLSASTQASGGSLLDLPGRKLIARVCLLSRVGKIWELINQALEALAIREPEWLLDNSLPHWYERYDPTHKNLNLNGGEDELLSSAKTIGQDGAYLLKAIKTAGILSLREIPEVIQLRHIWQEQYRQEQGATTWRPDACDGCILSATSGTIIFQ